jgi:hypothetical protein
MEISKLFSNEPLKLLKNHIQELQVLLKKEQEKNKNFKKILWKIQELSRNGKRKELSQFIDKTLNFSSDLSKSFLLTSTQIEGISEIFSGLVQIFRERLRIPFWKIRSFAAASEFKVFKSANCFKGAIGRVYRRAGYYYFEKLFKTKRMRVGLNDFSKLESIINKRMGVVWRRIILFVFEKKIKFQQFFNVLKKVFIKKGKIVILWTFKSIVNIEPSIHLNRYRKKSNNQKKVKNLENILKFLDRKGKKLVESGFFLLKLSSETLFIYEQGLLVLEKVINSQVFSLGISSFRTLQKVKPKSCRKLILNSFEKCLKVLISKQKFKIFTTIKFFSICFLSLKSPKLQILQSLSPGHYEISKKLMSIANFPLKIQKSLKKLAFLRLVSYVSYQISYDMLEENCLCRMAEIFKAFSTKKLHKSWNIWKNLVFALENSFFTNCSYVSERDMDPQKARLAFINMNLILQRQFSLNKSQGFMIWQEWVNGDVENKPANLFKEKECNSKQNLKKKFHLPLKLNTNVLNINN